MLRRDRPDLEQEFTRFFMANHRRTLAAIFPVVGDFSEAEDVTQEAYERAARHWHRIREYDEPSLWVRRVAINLAVSGLRRNRRRLTSSWAQLSEADDAKAPEREPEVELDLHRALRTLPVQYRAVLAMHYLWGFSVQEIADELGSPASTVHTRLVRARRLLAAAMQAGLVSEGGSGDGS